MLLKLRETQQLPSFSIRCKVVAKDTREVQPVTPKQMGTGIRVTTFSSREKALHLSAA